MINDQFELQQRIGSGSFGTVYRCIDKLTGEPRAVKIEKPKIRFS
jgi:serine/threonine protein kinase